MKMCSDVLTSNQRQSGVWQRHRTTWAGHRTEQIYTGRGGHRTYFLDYGTIKGGGHRTYFVDEENNWGGDTAQH